MVTVNNVKVTNKKWNMKFLENNVAISYIPLNNSNFWKCVEQYSMTHPVNFKYSNKSDFNKHQNDVRENFVGTLKEIECAIEKAKIDDENEYKESIEKYKKFNNDLVRLVKYELSTDYSELNEKQFNIIWDRAFEYGKIDGFYSIKDYFEDLADMFDSLKNV